MAKTNKKNTLDGGNYYKGRYAIAFYAADDETFVDIFDNVVEICEYKKKKNITFNDINLIRVDIRRALDREDHSTRMLNGELMHVYLIDMLEDDELIKEVKPMKFIKIHSSKNIGVSPAIRYVDATRFDSMNPNRLNVQQYWSQSIVDLKEGSHYYPALIEKWDTVQALARDGIITLGEKTDNCGSEQAEAEKLLAKLESNERQFEKALDKNEEIRKLEKERKIDPNAQSKY